jgi:hypothetical protein
MKDKRGESGMGMEFDGSSTLCFWRKLLVKLCTKGKGYRWAAAKLPAIF